MRKMCIGIVGCGMIGRMHAEVIKLIPYARLGGVADTNHEKCQQLASEYSCRCYYDYKDMLGCKDIDIISVCTPSGMHYDIVMNSAIAGKHVIVEKPIEVDMVKARKMVEVCKFNKIKLSVVLQHRFDTDIIALKKLIDDGEMGNLYYGTSKTIWYRDENYYKQNSWRGTWEYDGGGALINQSIHYIDLLLYIMGEVESVSGKCRTYRHKNIETEDTGIAILQFKNGSIGSIEGTTIAYPGLYTELSIYGEKGTVVIKNDVFEFVELKDDSGSKFKKVIINNKENRKVVSYTTGKSNASSLDLTSHKRLYEDLIDAIEKDREPSVSGEEGLRSLEAVKAIYCSSKEKKEVYV